MPSRFRESAFPQRGSHKAANATTSTHESRALHAATLNLTATSSSVEMGRVAIDSGIDKSPDQKSGFEDALPTARLKMIGIATVAASIRIVLPGSPRRYQDIGATIRINTPAMQPGKTIPERRHSNHSCA